MGLYAIQQDVAARLKERGCPIPVLYGPERTDTALATPRIVLERDGDDQIGAPQKGQAAGQRMHFSTLDSCVARIVAKSNLTGAGRHDHEEQAEQARDQLLVALRYAVVGGKKVLQIVGGGYLDAEQLELRGLTNWPGVVYELRFRVGTGVFDVAWRTTKADGTSVGGEGAPTVEVGENTIETTLTLQGPTGDPEIVCEP